VVSPLQGQALIMRILVASDGSEHSTAAVDAVLNRPWPVGSSITVISVAHAPFPMVDPYFGIGMAGYEKLSTALSQAAQQIADVVVATLRGAGFTADASFRLGDARVEILRAAEEWKADLIILGSHGRTGISRWLLGSVAEHVVRHASCSVEVARSSKRSD
jgi:nucleotide-binding universal stress UspA family protein